MPSPRYALAAAALLGQLFGFVGGHGRRAQAWAHAKGHIWGTCGSHWATGRGQTGQQDNATSLENVTSCLLQDGVKCSDRLSDGPADADMEVVLGNLPASTPEQDVYLHWWAAHKSPFDYDPLKSPAGCAVYGDMGTAYPNFWEPAFNGGNVRVNESGAAVFRVRSPSTYFMRPYLSLPHVHFRVCKGDASAQFYYDSLAINRGGFCVQTKSQDTKIVVLSKRAYVGVKVEDYTSPDPIGYLVYRADGTTTSSPAPPTTTKATTTVTTVTTVTTTTPAPKPKTMLEVALEAAQSALALDALEFSPVYECLVDRLVFDHFSGECAEQCPAEAVLHHGQCVLPHEESDPEVLLEASWELKVRCTELCGESMEQETLHNVRLSVAGHLTIPFQEVEKAALIWPDRRLTVGFSLDKQSVVLNVKVQTKRYDTASGLDTIRSFLDSPAVASQLLGMEVVEATLLADGTPNTDGDGPKWVLTSSSDPYAKAYEALILDADGGQDVNTEAFAISAPLVVGLAVAVLVCGAAAGALMWKLRRRALSKGDGVPPILVVGRPVEDDLPSLDLDVKKPEAKKEPKTAWAC